MKLDQFVIGIVIFGFAVFVMTYMMADVGNSYEDVNLSNDKYADVYNTINESYDFAQDMKESSLGTDIDDQESWESMTKGGYSTVRQIITAPFNIFASVMQAIARELGIHPFIVTTAIVVALLAIIFSIIYMVFRFKP